MTPQEIIGRLEHRLQVAYTVQLRSEKIFGEQLADLRRDLVRLATENGQLKSDLLHAKRDLKSIAQESHKAARLAELMLYCGVTVSPEDDLLTMDPKLLLDSLAHDNLVETKEFRHFLRKCKESLE